MFTTLSDEELDKTYVELIGLNRYFEATDDLSAWNREKEERLASRAKLIEIQEEYSRRNRLPPKVR